MGLSSTSAGELQGKLFSDMCSTTPEKQSYHEWSRGAASPCEILSAESVPEKALKMRKETWYSLGSHCRQQSTRVICSQEIVFVFVGCCVVNQLLL